MMTRKHFRAIAAILANNARAQYPQNIDALVSDFANLLAESNPRFDRQRFVTACQARRRSDV